MFFRILWPCGLWMFKDWELIFFPAYFWSVWLFWRLDGLFDVEEKLQVNFQTPLSPITTSLFGITSLFYTVHLVSSLLCCNIGPLLFIRRFVEEVRCFLYLFNFLLFCWKSRRAGFLVCLSNRKLARSSKEPALIYHFSRSFVVL